MHRMTGFDAQFIYDESPNEPQHTLKIAILGPEGLDDYTFERAKRGIRARLREVPPLHWRAIRVPFDLHHPVWVDADLDLDHHVRRLAIPSPGSRRELCEVISEIASAPLDPDRPLWENWFLEGYEGDKLVSVLKMSHALADGGSSRALLERALVPRPVSREVYLRETEPVQPAAPVPSKLALLRDAARDLSRDLFVNLPRLFRAARAVRERLRHEVLPPLVKSPFGAPESPFSGPLSRRRAFHFTTLSLAQAKEVKRTFGVTLNDVILAVAAGAARRYLEEREQLPDEPLLGAMPGSTRTEAQRDHFGNRLTTRFLRLPTHLADPVERLRAAHGEAAHAKRDMKLRESAQPEQWLELLPPFLVKLASRLAAAALRLAGGQGGIVVSSVPGPTERLYAGSVPVENFVSVGHMKYVASLNLTVWSYADNLNFALYTCARAVPDLERISGTIEEAFEELVKAADASQARVTPRDASPRP